MSKPDLRTFSTANYLLDAAVVRLLVPTLEKRHALCRSLDADHAFPPKLLISIPRLSVLCPSTAR